MRFLTRDDVQKTYLVVSDIHLGAGPFVEGKRNVLEEFHSDEEFVDFLDYYSSGDFKSREVELVINGDFLDFLAVPYVNYFDDYFWSEHATLKKLDMIINAHATVFHGLKKFLSNKNKKVVYIIGNHDAELLFESVQWKLKELISREDNFEILIEGSYFPQRNILIQHGHSLERPHSFNINDNIVNLENGERFFIPPWGSYFVTRVINKFKEERSFLGAFKPFKVMLVHGLIFDTLFTLRFMFTSWYYLFMVRIIRHFNSARNIRSWKDTLKDIWDGIQMELGFETKFSDEAQKIFSTNPQLKLIIMGHNHEAEYTEYPDGNTYLNTGTWTRFFHLDFSRLQLSRKFTYAQIDIRDKTEKMDTSLFCWRGRGNLPFEDYMS